MAGWEKSRLNVVSSSCPGCCRGKVVVVRVRVVAVRVVVVVVVCIFVAVVVFVTVENKDWRCVVERVVFVVDDCRLG